MVNFKELFQYTTKLNILYVEDDLILLEKTTSFLEELFNKVITAVDGVEGLEEYKKYKKDNNEYFDLVITDINMPKKDGLVMIKDIFNLNKHQPIIVISAHNESEKHYKSRPLSAGKNIDKTRFNFTKVSKFELLDDNPSRIKVVYFDKNMHYDYKNKLKFFEELYNKEK
jgi:CheY-like chemotaxis protein